MGALAVVEAFDVIEKLEAGLVSRFKPCAIDQFQFEAAPEAFHGRVVIAIGFPTHGGKDSTESQCSAIVACGVLDTAIGVEKKVFGMAAVKECHVQSS